MTTREVVLQVLTESPDDAEIDDVIERLYFVAKLQQRLSEMDSVEKYTQEEAKERMARWLQ